MKALTSDDDTAGTDSHNLRVTDPPAVESGARVVCAWCTKVLREGVEPVSHGICPDCASAFENEIALVPMNREELQLAALRHVRGVS